ncbi:Tetratricopeptide repeat protein 5 [Eumeta japonica]|uniref:Tetratricopeptide repeat protein 5 n=1 Tax=Eumeta variegata TaxID=151549 RepID=A0A4C1Y5M9_EUMVA|nr:Tetratricopeptide repeat protein 5 [Eumeta japonica]
MSEEEKVNKAEDIESLINGLEWGFSIYARADPAFESDRHYFDCSRQRSSPESRCIDPSGSALASTTYRYMKQMNDLYLFRDFYFEDHPLDRAAHKKKQVDEKKDILIEKFNEIDENLLTLQNRARFLYMKGRTYNLSTSYDYRASECLSKAVKLNPRLVDAWNELGECYWKNLNMKDAKSSFEGALRTALRYDERYGEALENLTQASRLDPIWSIPKTDMNKLVMYISQLHVLVKTKGKIKVKKLQQMVQSLDKNMLGPFSENTFHTIGPRKDVLVEHCRLDALTEGTNLGKVVYGRVVGSIYSENVVPL